MFGDNKFVVRFEDYLIDCGTRERVASENNMYIEEFY